MKYLITAVFLTILNICIAQQPGASLINETSEWYAQGNAQYSSPVDCNLGFAVTKSDISYYIQGDTVINTLTYLKMYWTQTDSSYCLNNTFEWVESTSGLKHYIREENQKILAFDMDLNEEIIIYNYAAIGMGSTIGSDCFVTSIDTLFLFQQPYLKYNCSCETDYLIQGIGTSRTFFTDIECGSGIEGDIKNVCYSKNGYTIILDSLKTCFSVFDTIVNGTINPLTETSSHRIYPNPTTGYINIQVNQNQIESYSVYTIDGKKMMHQNHIHADMISINISHLVKGIYFLVFEQNNGVTIREKIMKSE